MKIPKSIKSLIESFEKLPGIGPKTAQRLTFYLLHVPDAEIEKFADSLNELKKKVKLCKVCKGVSEEEVCEICQDVRRVKSMIMVVEQPLDVFAIERSGKFNGVYHVLHGAINPLENIGPDEIFVDELLQRIKLNGSEKVLEVIIATNPTMEGEATAMYLAKKIREINPRLEVTRLGRGIPTGADIEYADELTLREAIDGRRKI